ncbi:MAG: tetratricopeptide repeat protein [bacterium]
MKKNAVVIVALLSMMFFISGYTRPDVYTIDATKNAIIHNNLGLNALDDNNYYEAVQEFILAIALNPKTQATAVYYNNLGETYMKIGYFKEAQSCFENSIKQYTLNFLYYQNLVKSFKAQKIIGSKIKFYENQNKKNSLNMVLLGLLYIENGDFRRGIIKLDEFCMKEPDLLITSGVRSYLKGIIPSN